jgi:hypothetical protein
MIQAPDEVCPFFVEGTWEYVEQIVMNSRQVVPYLGEFAMN